MRARRLHRVDRRRRVRRRADGAGSVRGAVAGVARRSRSCAAALRGRDRVPRVAAAEVQPGERVALMGFGGVGAPGDPGVALLGLRDGGVDARRAGTASSPARWERRGSVTPPSCRPARATGPSSSRRRGTWCRSRCEGRAARRHRESRRHPHEHDPGVGLRVALARAQPALRREHDPARRPGVHGPRRGGAHPRRVRDLSVGGREPRAAVRSRPTTCAARPSSR